MVRRSSFVLVVLALLASVTSEALAAKPGGGGSVPSSIRLNQPDPHHGDLVTFTVTHPAMRETPRVRVLCEQNRAQVYQYASDPGALYRLSGTNWQAGAADCSADLYYFTYKGQTQTGIVYLAHTDFAVGE